MSRTILWAMVLGCIPAGCNNDQQKEEKTKLMDRKIDIQGHRGSRGLMPENTWPAMKAALDLGVTTLEMDVVITRDSQVILSHEPWMGHDIATRPDGSLVTAEEAHDLNIFQMDYSEVMKYDVGMRPHPRFPRQQKIAVYKPTLASILDSVQLYMRNTTRPFPFFNIETKTQPSGDGVYHPDPATFCELLLQVTGSKDMIKYVTIQSFDPRTLQYIHKKDSSISTALLVEADNGKTLEQLIQDMGFIPSVFSPAHEIVTSELVKECHEMGMKIIPWTVNTRERIDQLTAMDVDGIITDYPDLFKTK